MSYGDSLASGGHIVHAYEVDAAEYSVHRGGERAAHAVCGLRGAVVELGDEALTRCSQHHRQAKGTQLAQARQELQIVF